MTGHGARPVWMMRDSETGLYVGEPKNIEFPFEYAWAYFHGQPIEFDNGDFMFTLYYEPLNGETSGLGSTTTYNVYFRAVTARYSFDGENFTLVKAGTPIKLHAGRGADEPCLAKFGDKYYLTLRTDENAYLAWSDDGEFQPLAPRIGVGVVLIVMTRDVTPHLIHQILFRIEIGVVVS